VSNVQFSTKSVAWRFAGREFHLGPPPAPPLIMGIVNATPDSFSDGGMCLDPDAAVQHALELVQQGADIIDIGGESTRPGAESVPPDLELQRVLPVIEGLRRQSKVLMSIDTSKSAVARRALAAGAEIINDVSAMRADANMVDVAAGSSAGVIIMHMLGTPKTMQQAPRYDDVVADVRALLAERLAWLDSRGILRDRVAVDPGLGFGKTFEHNLRLMHSLADFAPLDRPICLGPSRKSFIGKILGRDVHERIAGTAGVCVAGFLRGAHILRVHDVAAVRDAITMVRAVELGRPPA
jgi:dihydropteroate synthase